MLYFVNDFKVIESSKDIVVELDNESFNPREVVILMTNPRTELRSQVPGLPPEARLAKGGRSEVSFLKYEPNTIILKANVNKPGFLILGNNLNNNWKVKVNKKKAKHLQANLIQRAVYLPSAGNYLIEFYYFPKLFLIGFLITLFAVLVLIFSFLFLKYSTLSNKLFSVPFTAGPATFRYPSKLRHRVPRFELFPSGVTPSEWNNTE